MRYTKTAVVSLCMVIGVISTSVNPTSMPIRAQEADPFVAPEGHHPTNAPLARRSAGDRRAAVADLSPHERIRAALNEPCTLDYEEMAWSEIQEELESRYRFNIVLTQSARDDSLDIDKPVSVSLKGIKLGNALRLMLTEKNATFVVQDDALLIISLDDRQDPRFFSRRIIDVSGILNSANLWHERQRSTNRSRNDKQPMDVGMVGGISGGNAQPYVDENTLADLVLHSVQPEAWRDNPYSRRGRQKQPAAAGLATCTGFCGQLIVNGPQQLQGEVESFLSEIKSSFTR